MSKKQIIFEKVRLGKLVHGGQCIARTENGKTLFVWGGLPGELVDVRITKKKSNYREGIATEIHEASTDRIEPLEPLSYLSTSPWQIMIFDAENKAKQSILAEAFEREGVADIKWVEFTAGTQEYGYRNKQEYGFWGDEEGLHIAHYVRGTKGKQMVQGSALAMVCINEAARAVRDELNRLEIWGGDLKTIMLRANQQKEVVGALFIKKEPSDVSMGNFRLPKELKGLVIYYSNPKSPASVPTEMLYSFGDITLTDSIMGTNITYDVLSFFQVNLPILENSLKEIKKRSSGAARVIDMYSGVGTIGVLVGANVLVESDEGNIQMAQENVAREDIEVVHASSETALKYMHQGDVLIVDPPRAGLHLKVVEQILETKPAKVIYLSCNPSTQARDARLLQETYKIQSATGYNFFPRTPHIESLLVLELK